MKVRTESARIGRPSDSLSPIIQVAVDHIAHVGVVAAVLGARLLSAQAATVPIDAAQQPPLAIEFDLVPTTPGVTARVTPIAGGWLLRWSGLTPQGMFVPALRVAARPAPVAAASPAIDAADGSVLDGASLPSRSPVARDGVQQLRPARLALQDPVTMALPPVLASAFGVAELFVPAASVPVAAKVSDLALPAAGGGGAIASSAYPQVSIGGFQMQASNCSYVPAGPEPTDQFSGNVHRVANLPPPMQAANLWVVLVSGHQGTGTALHSVSFAPAAMPAGGINLSWDLTLAAGDSLSLRIFDHAPLTDELLGGAVLWQL